MHGANCICNECLAFKAGINTQLNPRNNSGIIDHFDKGHGGEPDHYDLTVSLKPDFGIPASHKIKIDGSGSIIDDDIIWSKKPNNFGDS